MFLINLDENNIVTAYSKGDGYIEGYVEVEFIPDNFAPKKWLYIDGEYLPNPDYVEPSGETASDEPTSEEILNVLLGV